MLVSRFQPLARRDSAPYLTAGVSPHPTQRHIVHLATPLLAWQLYPHSHFHAPGTLHRVGQHACRRALGADDRHGERVPRARRPAARRSHAPRLRACGPPREALKKEAVKSRSFDRYRYDDRFESQDLEKEGYRPVLARARITAAAVERAEARAREAEASRGLRVATTTWRIEARSAQRAALYDTEGMVVSTGTWKFTECDLCCY